MVHLGRRRRESNTQYTIFEAYGGERRADILTLRLIEPYRDATSELQILAGGYWNVLLPRLSEDWHYFEKVSIQPVRINGQLFFRMEYRYQAEEDECLLSEVALASISSGLPNKPFGFITTATVCSEVLATYSGERETILNSFRP